MIQDRSQYLLNRDHQHQLKTVRMRRTPVHTVSKKKWRRVHVPNNRWNSKAVRKRPWIARILSKTRTTWKEWRSQWRTSRGTRRFSTDRMKRRRWSPERFLVYSRWLHLSSSQRTSSSTLCAEGRNILYSTAVHWCSLVHSHRFGCNAGQAYGWLLERQLEQNFVRFLERIHKIHSTERKLRKGIFVVRW